MDAPSRVALASSDPLGERGMKYTCEGFAAIDAANIVHAARIFANRVAHQKYGSKGRCRKLRVQTDRGTRGASFEAFVGIPPLYGPDVGENYHFTVLVVRGTVGPKSSAPVNPATGL